MVSGRATCEGRPLPGATVLGLAADFGDLTARATCDADGTFTLERAEVVVVLARGGESGVIASAVVPATNAGEIAVQAAAPVWPVSLEVRTEAGEPPPGPARVRFVPAAAPHVPEHAIPWMLTGERGQLMAYAEVAAPTGEARVWVQEPRWLLTGDAGQVALALASSGQQQWVAVAALGPDGSPLAGDSRGFELPVTGPTSATLLLRAF